LIATDGVFSMDGYLAPLADICDLAERYDAMVLVDDSHAVGFVGATGAVGETMLKILAERNFPVGKLHVLASERSAGSEVHYGAKSLIVQDLATFDPAGVDIALFSAGASISRAFVPIAAARGCVVVDNSSAFRMDPGTPLVVPEVNGGLLATRPLIVANPNCVAAIAVMPLAPLHAHNPIVRVIGSTYQSASGAGAAAMEELELSTAARLAGQAFTQVRAPPTSDRCSDFVSGRKSQKWRFFGNSYLRQGARARNWWSGARPWKPSILHWRGPAGR